MKLENLLPAEGSVQKSFRAGRGIGSGNGRTSGRGHKGAKSRSGHSRKIGFEGGQMPLQRRVPKFGFNSPNHKYYRVINLDLLQELSDAGKLSEKINKELFVSLGLADKKDLVKILGRGEIKSTLHIEAHKFSNSAKKAIESAGGSVHLID